MSVHEPTAANHLLAGPDALESPPARAGFLSDVRFLSVDDRGVDPRPHAGALTRDEV
jgi:hypothetical protein